MLDESDEAVRSHGTNLPPPQRRIAVDTPPLSGNSSLLGQAVYGVAVGALLGGLTAIVCCWLIEEDDSYLSVAPIAAFASAGLGGVLAVLERLVRGPFVRSDIATVLGLLIGAVPGLQMLFGLTEARVSVRLFAGTAFIFPMTGLLIGAFFDRAHDAVWRSRGEAVRYALAGLGLCVGLAYLLIANPPSLDVALLANDAKGAIRGAWKEDAATRDWKVTRMTLKRLRRGQYAGPMEVLADGERLHFHVDVRVHGESISVRWEPVQDKP